LEDLFYADFEIVPFSGLIVLSSAWFAHARVCQGTGGRILGRVSDSSGAVLAGVQVTLTHESRA